MPQKSTSQNRFCPWMVVYNGGDNGVEYLSQKDHDNIVSAIKKGMPTIVFPDGRIFNAMGGFQRIIANPEYIDPVEDEKKSHYYFLWNRYQSLKKAGTFDERYEKDPTFKFKAWYKENKEELDREYKAKKI